VHWSEEQQLGLAKMSDLQGVAGHSLSLFIAARVLFDWPESASAGTFRLRLRDAWGSRGRTRSTRSGFFAMTELLAIAPCYLRPAVARAFRSTEGTKGGTNSSKVNLESLRRAK
jgi:hypothetical protein